MYIYIYMYKVIVPFTSYFMAMATACILKHIQLPSQAAKRPSEAAAWRSRRRSVPHGCGRPNVVPPVGTPWMVENTKVWRNTVCFFRTKHGKTWNNYKEENRCLGTDYGTMVGGPRCWLEKQSRHWLKRNPILVNGGSEIKRARVRGYHPWFFGH